MALMPVVAVANVALVGVAWFGSSVAAVVERTLHAQHAA